MHFFSFLTFSSILAYAIFVDNTLLLIYASLLLIYTAGHFWHQRKKINSLEQKVQAASFGPTGQPRCFGRQDADTTKALDFIRHFNKENPGEDLSMIVLFAKALGVGFGRTKKLIGKISFGQFILKENVNLSVLVPIDGKSFERVLLEKCDSLPIKELNRQFKSKLAQAKKYALLKNKAKRSALLDWIPTVFIHAGLKLISWLNYDCGLPVPFARNSPDFYGYGLLVDVGPFGLTDVSLPLFPNMKSVFVCTINAPFQRPVYVGDKLEVKSLQYFTITFDHRFGDGADVIKMLNSVYEVFADIQKYV